jgi:hypothetical protein
MMPNGNQLQFALSGIPATSIGGSEWTRRKEDGTEGYSGDIEDYSGRYPIYRFIGALHDREDLISGEGFASYKRIKPSRNARSS